MKRIKNNVLSVLLFAFAILVVHDYVIEFFDADTQYELCYSGYDVINSSSLSSLDVPSQIHDNIHSVLESYIIEPLQLNATQLKTNPHAIEIASISYISFVPQRPPLI
jgi:hypothetical protein